MAKTRACGIQTWIKRRILAKVSKMDKLEEKIAELVKMDKEMAKQIRDLLKLMMGDNKKMEYVR